MKSTLTVWGNRGTGSTIAEAFLTLGKISFEHQEVDYDLPGPKREELLKLNPLGQVPTLVLPDGSILTETLAVAALVDLQNPDVGLIPKKTSDAEKFWRWACFVIAAIYPTFTYGDTPSKWVANEEGAKQLRSSTDRWREKLWLQVEAQIQGPYFLGEKLCALDIYLAVMVHWRPRKAWFVENCPKINSIAEKIQADSRLSELWRMNF